MRPHPKPDFIHLDTEECPGEVQFGWGLSDPDGRFFTVSLTLDGDGVLAIVTRPGSQTSEEDPAKVAAFLKEALESRKTE